MAKYRSRASWRWLSDRGMGASVVVSTLASAFGVYLVLLTTYIGAVLRADPAVGNRDTLYVVISVLAPLLIAVALYIAGVVTANTFAVVVEGRVRRIALLRLLGATARSQRAAVTRQGLGVGAIGSALGALVGVGCHVATMLIGAGLVTHAPEDVPVLQLEIVAPMIGVTVTTWLAAYVGSRRVLAVSPMQALGSSTERTIDDLPRSGRRNIAAVVMFCIGLLGLAAGVALGMTGPMGIVIAFVGGVFSFTGFSLGATLFMPFALRAVGRLLGRSTPARLAAQNAVRYPERSSRAAMGVAMGIALVTMFAVALSTTRTMMTRQGAPDDFLRTIDTFAIFMSALTAISAVIAAVGAANLLGLGIAQRRRELGLMRVIGLDGRQLRRMILLEGVHIIATASFVGATLGVGYGWVGAQSALGYVPVLPDFQPAGFVAPTIPWAVIGATVLGAAVVVVLSAVVTTRRVSRESAVESLT